MLKILQLCAILAASLAFSTPAAAEITALPAGEVTVELSCEEAANGYADVQAGTAGPDRIIQVLNALNKCGAAAYNKAQEANGSSQRAVATATVEQGNGKQRVLFGLLTVDKNDIEATRQICSAGAKVVGGSFADPILTPVITATGEYSCGAYVDAAVASNKLLLFAPTLVPSVSLTADVLRRAGVSEQDIQNGLSLINSVTEAASKAGTDVARGAVSVATLGVVKIDKKLKCAKIFGKKVCR